MRHSAEDIPGAAVSSLLVQLNRSEVSCGCPALCFLNRITNSSRGEATKPSWLSCEAETATRNSRNAQVLIWQAFLSVNGVSRGSLCRVGGDAGLCREPPMDTSTPARKKRTSTWIRNCCDAHKRRTSFTSAANLLPALTECPADVTLEKHPSGFPQITTLGSQSEHHGGDSLTAFLKPH